MIFLAIFIPTFIFVLLPMATRYYLVNEARVPEVQLFAIPQLISVKAGIPGPDFEPTLRLRDLTVVIPSSMTPVLIEPGTIVLRQHPNAAARTLGIYHPTNIPTWTSGADIMTRLLMPSDPEEFLRATLRATWHPVRLLSKATMITSLAIQTKVWEGQWQGGKTVGFIFPTFGEKGFVGRIFSREGKPTYCEFSYADEVNPIKIREWCELAGRMRWNGGVPESTGAASAAEVVPADVDSMAASVEDSSCPHQQEIVFAALQRYLDTSQPDWLFPVVLAQSKRGFLPEAIRLIQRHLPALRHEPRRMAVWYDLLDRVAQRLIKLNMDPHLQLHRFSCEMKNLTTLSLTKIRLRLKIERTTPEGVREVDECRVTLLPQARLHPLDTKIVDLDVPANVQLRGINKVTWKFEGLDILE